MYCVSTQFNKKKQDTYHSSTNGVYFSVFPTGQSDLNVPNAPTKFHHAFVPCFSVCCRDLSWKTSNIALYCFSLPIQLHLVSRGRWALHGYKQPPLYYFSLKKCSGIHANTVNMVVYLNRKKFINSWYVSISQQFQCTSKFCLYESSKLTIKEEMKVQGILSRYCMMSTEPATEPKANSSH